MAHDRSRDEFLRSTALAQATADAQSEEAAFHSLRGQIRLQQERYQDAETNFTRALERDDGYYAYYLGRGIARAKRGARVDAKADLNASLERLPTTIAYLELGKIAEAEGNPQLAAQYYQAAGGSDGPVGQEARARLARLYGA